MTEAETLNNKKVMFGKGERDYSVDLVRSFSCLMVVAIHASGLMMARIPYDAAAGVSGDWLHLALMRCTTVAATNIFLMISGIFFLSPERNVSISKVWSKNILKLATAYVLWCMIYSYVRITYLWGQEFDWSQFWQETVNRENHLWYIPMMLGIYVMVPLMRVFTAHAERKHYIYLIWLMIGAMALNSVKTFSTQYPYGGSENVIHIINDTPAPLICQFPFYCILGYYLYTYRPKTGTRILLYILGIAGILMMTWITTFFYVEKGIADPYQVQGKFELYVLAKNTAIFVFILSVFSKVRMGKGFKKVLSKVSAATLFIYLVHMMYLNVFLHEEWLLDSGLSYFKIALIYTGVIYFSAFIISFMFLQLIPWTRMRNVVLDAVWPNRRIWNGGRKK